jgi:hypothetical protein
VARLILAAIVVLALSELTPARAQFVIGSPHPFGYYGGYSYSSRSGFGFSFGGSHFRVRGFAGGFSGGYVTRSYFGPPLAFVPVAPFGPFGPVGFAPVGVFRFGNPFWGGWAPLLGLSYGPAYVYGFAPPVIAVPVPVVVGGIVPNPGDAQAGNILPRNDGPILPQGAKPGDFLVIAPKREVTVPEVTRVAPRPPRPTGPVIAFDPFKPAAGVKAEVPDPEPKKEAARLVKLARASFGAGDYGRAAEHFERAIAADPTEAAVYFWHAQAKFAAGQYAEAVARIREGLARDPRWPASDFDPAALYGDHPARFFVHLLALRKAVDENPNQATLEFLLGYELWFSGDKVEANKLFRAAEKRLAAPGPIALFK